MESKPTVSAYRAPNNSPALQRAVTRRRQGQLSIGGIGPHRPTHIIRLPHYQHRPLHRSRNQRVRSGMSVLGLPIGPPNRSSAVSMCMLMRIAAFRISTEFCAIRGPSTKTRGTRMVRGSQRFHCVPTQARTQIFKRHSREPTPRQAQGLSVQFSMFNLGTRANSRVWFVTSVTPRLRAWAAMERSFAPIIVPRVFKWARIFA